MRAASGKDYDDYDELASWLASWLAERVELYGQQGTHQTEHEFLYSMIKEFNRTLDES